MSSRLYFSSLRQDLRRVKDLRPTGSKLIRFYLVLLAFALLVLGLSLGLNHRLGGLYKNSVTFSHDGSARSERYLTLEELTRPMNAAPNNVFDSKDPDLEEQKGIEAMAAFRAESSAVRAAHDRRTDQNRALTIVLDQIIESTETMHSQALILFQLFREGDVPAAASQMSLVDRTYARVLFHFTSLEKKVNEFERRELDANLAAVKQVEQLEYLMVALGFLLILPAGFYARRLSRQMVGIDVLADHVAALEKSEERFHMAARASRDVIWEWDVESGRMWFSEGARDIYSVELDPDGWIDLKKAVRWIHPDDLGDMRTTVSTAVRSKGSSWESTYRLVHGDGTVFQVIGRAEIVRDGRGRALKMIGTVTDVTGSENAARALRESEERFQLAASATRDVFWDWDLQTNLVWVNDIFVEAFEVQASGNIIKNSEWAALVHPDDIDRTWAGIQRVLASPSNVWMDNYRIRRRDGTYAETWNRAVLTRTAEGSPARMVGTMVDVTERERAAKALEASEERFKLVALATNDGLWDWDLKTNEVWVNDTCLQDYGMGSQNVISLDDWSALVHPEDSPVVLDSLHAFMKGEQSFWTGEYRLRLPDGAYADIYDRAALVRGPDGAALRMIGAMTNVTHRKQAELAILEANRDLDQLNRRTQLILNSAADAILGISSDHKITFANPAAARALGCPSQELLGCDLNDCVKADIFSGEVGDRVLRTAVFSRSNGSTFPVEYLLNEIVQPEKTWSFDPVDAYVAGFFEPSAEPGAGYVLTFRDVTERQIVQKLKNEFVSVVSHELRTPLTSIRGALGLLAGGMLGEINDRGRRMLEIAVTNTDRLVRLINDILDIERMEMGNVTLATRKCEVLDLIEQAVDVMGPMAEKAGVRLEKTSEGPSMIWADPDRILQTLTNLLSNAIKFSAPGTAIRVSARTADHKVLFQVADQGRGIPTDKLEAVFERFHQVDASDSREKGGSGLGLAICRSIVRQHGGEIWVTSAPGEGSTFWFTIPASSSPSSVELRDGARPTGERRLLVCDDDDSVREVLRTMLESRGFEVLALASGIEVLKQVENFRPDAILLDVLMPDMDGWETMAALRANPLTSEVPILFVTVTPEAESAGRDNPPLAWIQKPLDETSLVDALHGILQMEERDPRVVLVEDDLDLANVISSSFERLGIRTFHAATGAKALELLERIVPDLVVLDVELPELDGYSVVAGLRERKDFRHVPVVVYSAEDVSLQNRERLTLGPTEFLTKSRVSPAEFERRVVGMLSELTGSRRGSQRHVA